MIFIFYCLIWFFSELLMPNFHDVFYDTKEIWISSCLWNQISQIQTIESFESINSNMLYIIMPYCHFLTLMLIQINDAIVLIVTWSLTNYKIVDSSIIIMIIIIISIFLCVHVYLLRYITSCFLSWMILRLITVVRIIMMIEIHFYILNFHKLTITFTYLQ